MITHVIARTIVFDAQGRVLQLVRSLQDKYRAGGVDFPGGKVDEGEEVLAGALRETLEETGLVLDPLRTRLVYAGATAGYNQDHESEVNIVKLFYAVQVDDTMVILSDEHKGSSWLPLDEAIAHTDHPNHKKVLEYIRDNHIVSEFWDK